MKQPLDDNPDPLKTDLGSEQRDESKAEAPSHPDQTLAPEQPSRVQSPAEPVSSVDTLYLRPENSSEERHPKDLDSTVPQSRRTVGRYQICQIIGRGGFGEVFLAFDEQLKRDVAVKLTSGSQIGPNRIRMFLAEAQILAELDHPNIVPVFDMGATEQNELFIVSKLIQGTDLATRIDTNRPDRALSLEIVAAIADALHYSHRKGLTHRDVKPGNILLDKSDRPYLTDFGLALRDSDSVQEGEICGTPAYMSPEQARGEGHRIDGRSDIYSLGVVLYELITGHRPFNGKNSEEFLRKVQIGEFPPPRTFDSTIDRKLEMVCLKALARRPSDRFALAKDLADEIRWLLRRQPGDRDQEIGFDERGISRIQSRGLNFEQEEFSDRSSIISRNGLSVRPRMKKVVPKGLRSFDARDSEFFLGLVCGPFDREGLPESIRFWKTRIESTEASGSFRVGLVYGPSGCGKSSLMKAGLLPNLSPLVESIYIEATPMDTPDRILKELQKRIPDLPARNLTEALSLIRRRKLVPGGGKLLLVIDQFEQWLNSQGTFIGSALTTALSQCDGETVQALILVRDEFWLSVSRFFAELDIPILERENSRLVDLFDLVHARKLLSYFGRAYGRLPEAKSSWSEEQNAFLDQAINELSENDKVIPVRLALFVEMMKGKTWTPETIADVGGMSGLGVVFLQETFGQKYAPIQYKRHHTAVRNFLRALLPPIGTEIKGTKQTLRDLQEICGYGPKPQDFADLVRILNSDLRIITPVDDGSGTPSYELTHDYLVPSLREWLTLEQRQTRKGVAELKLADLAATWEKRKENKLLPSLLEWFQIRHRTVRTEWTKSESRMMLVADRYHWTRLGIVGIVTAILISMGIVMEQWLSWREHGQAEDGLIASVKYTDWTLLPKELDKITQFRPGIDLKVRASIEETSQDSEASLKLNLAIIDHTGRELGYVSDRLLSADPRQIPLLVSRLKPFSYQLINKYWGVAENGAPRSLLQAASALAAFEPKSERWKTISTEVVKLLVKQDPLVLTIWVDALRPSMEHLIPDLMLVVLSTSSTIPQSEKDIALDILESCTLDLDSLHQLIVRGEPRVFEKFFDQYQRYGGEAIVKLCDELRNPIPAIDLENETEPDRLLNIQIRANACIALLGLKHREPVYEFLSVNRDPEALSQFIHRLRGRNIDFSCLLESFEEIQTMAEPENPVERQQQHYRLYGMILGLGEYDPKQLPVDQRNDLLKKLSTMYATHPSRTIHSAVGWLLKRWDQYELIQSVDQNELPYDTTGVRDWFVIRVDPPKLDNEPHTESWDLSAPIFITMIVFPGGEIEIGQSGSQRKINLPGPFAVSDREITWQQFSPLDHDSHRLEGEKRFKRQLNGKRLTPDEPVFGVNWFEAVSYCRWLTECKMPGEINQSYLRKELLAENTKAPGWLEFPDNKDWDWGLDRSRPGFRLLTEAEWEYVARAGMVTQYSFGTSVELLADYGWYADNSGNRMSRTGLLRPSLVGLFDTHGNLYEWVDDWLRNGPNRIYRGGGWRNVAEGCRSTYRRWSTPDNRDDYLGFRIARSLVDIAQAPVPQEIVDPTGPELSHSEPEGR